MRRLGRGLPVIVLLIGTVGCVDLDVANPNAPDLERALATAGDVESLNGGAFYSWHRGSYWFAGPGLFLSTQSFQHSSWSCCAGLLSAIPRPAIVNDPADPAYRHFTEPWTWNYRALSAAADGLRAIAGSSTIVNGLGEEGVLRARAYGRFVQGMAHATLAILYDRAFVVDETTELVDASGALALEKPLGYDAVMDAALGYFDEAIELAGQGSFTIPTQWLPTYTETTAAELARVAHSMKARYRAAVARTPAERRAVDWAAVIADVDAGVQDDWDLDLNAYDGWWNDVILYGTFRGWSQVANFVSGMADTSGNYQRWLEIPLLEREEIFRDGDPFLYFTPYTRYPKGTTVAEQVANPGTLYKIPTAEIDGWNISGVWQKPDRGSWRWSYYWGYEYNHYYLEDWRYSEIDIDEMRMLKAEGLYHQGDRAGAASLVNLTRTAAGLDATDAAGTNTSCVPRLPDGTCGDLFEMLKWEKRHEARFDGLLSAPWYFDSRGWGDLYRGTQLQFPIPCQELQIMDMMPCYSFGGVGGDMAADRSMYRWPGEG